MTLRNGLIALPRRHTFPHLYPEIMAGAPLAIVISSTSLMGFVSSQSPPAIDDSFQYECPMQKGRWHLVISHTRNTASGIITFSLDTAPGGVNMQSCGAMDLYGTTLLNNRQSIIFDVLRDDYYYLVATMSAKNPSSSGYQAALTLIELTRRIV